MEIQGKIHLIGQVESFGNNGFKKRQLVIETQEQYKQTIPIDFVKEKTSLLDNFTIGQLVKVSINIRGNEYNGKYYVNVQGWRIEGMAQSESSIPSADVFDPSNHQNSDDHDDLPF